MVVTSDSCHLLFVQCLPTRLDSLCFVLVNMPLDVAHAIPSKEHRTTQQVPDFIQISINIPFIEKLPLRVPSKAASLQIFNFPHCAYNLGSFLNTFIKCCWVFPKGCHLCDAGNLFILSLLFPSVCQSPEQCLGYTTYSINMC